MCRVKLERMSGSGGVMSLAAPPAMEHCVELSGAKHSGLPHLSPHLALTSHKRTTLSRQYDQLACTTHSLFILEIYLLKKFLLVSQLVGWVNILTWKSDFQSVTDRSTREKKSWMLSWWGMNKRNAPRVGRFLRKPFQLLYTHMKISYNRSSEHVHNCYQA